MLLVSPIWLQHFIVLQFETCYLSPLCLEFLLAKGANMTPISLGLCEIIHGRQLAQCLAHNKHSVKVRHGYYHVDYCYFCYILLPYWQIWVLQLGTSVPPVYWIAQSSLNFTHQVDDWCLFANTKNVGKGRREGGQSSHANYWRCKPNMQHTYKT